MLQTTLGDIELAFFPDVAPITVAHILELGRLGLYTSNHFFRVDKGFVAQVRRAGGAEAWSHSRGTGGGCGGWALRTADRAAGACRQPSGVSGVR